MRIIKLVLVIILASSLCACGRIRIIDSNLLSSEEGVSTPSSSYVTITPTTSVFSIYEDIMNNRFGSIGLDETYTSKQQHLFDDICKQIEGTWLNDIYIENIKNKQYIFKGVPTPNSIVISFDDEQNRYEWLATCGEEGDNEYFDKIEIEYGSDSVYLVINQIRNLKIEIDEEGIKKILWKDIALYKISGSQDNYINRYILQGKYKDNLGKEYSFTENSVAIWPDRTFEYTFWCSYFANKNTMTVIKENGAITQENYAFEFIDKKLYIYETVSEGWGITVSDTPFLILERVDEE